MNIKPFVIILTCNLVLTSSQVFAKSNPVNSNTTNKVSKIVDISNISGSFLQIQNSNNKTKEFTGTFNFSKPNKFIWEYQKPFKQIIQSDGNKLYIYDKDLQQVSIKNADEAISSSPIAVFLNNHELDKHFSSSVGTSIPILYANSTDINKLDKNILSSINKWVSLAPKAKDSIYKNLSIGIDNLSMPKVLLFQDNLGNSGIIQLDKVTSQKFKDGYFKFDIPKDVDVIKN
ncbi:MAG: hypothetical protein RLZZ210_1378 [Pseudomonadota bacterium]|jgi:outer membrane lipoprotein carrier protein